MQYGDFVVYRINEGQFNVGVDKKFHPHTPGAPFPKGTIFIAANAFVVKTPQDIIMLDCGLGEEAEGRDITQLLEDLAKHDIRREDVTKVVFSHLHADHIGGATYRIGAERRPTFPNATYYAQEGETTTTFSYKAHSATLREITLETLDDHGQLVLLSGDGWIGDEIEYQLTGGHTEFHQAIWLHSGGRSILFGGDVLPQPSQINRRFLAKYDFDPEGSQTKRAALAKTAWEHGQLILMYHATQETAAFLTGYSERAGYTIELIDL